MTVEPLGFVHAHIFVKSPSPEWLACPFGIEAAWVTPDFLNEVLYLHCLVPTELRQRDPFKQFPRASYTIIWSSTGSQQLITDDEPTDVQIATKTVSDDLLKKHPFVIPAIAESWTYPNSLPLLWARIHKRLGSRTRAFLPRTRIHSVNGKAHLTTVYRTLKEAGLLHQHIVRYHPLLAVSVEIFLATTMSREEIGDFAQHLRGFLHAIEAYPTEGGHWCRLLGPHKLLDAIITLPDETRAKCSSVYFHTKRLPIPSVRFAYEQLFDPKTGTWQVNA